ncbi:MAG: radical SAM/SPASM domain-containing protein [Vicinamibacterales bacterium]
MAGLTAWRRQLQRAVFLRLPPRLQDAYASLRFARRYRLPNTIYLETTSACNLNCVMCAAQRPAVKAVKPSGYMELALFRRLVDELAGLPSIQSVYLHKDGEPLLHPDIVEMIGYAASRHPNVTLVTNATRLDAAMARAILATPLQQIRFSVDGLSKATFEKVRVQRPDNEFAGSGERIDHDAVMANIEQFLAIKAEVGNRTMRVGMRTTAFKGTAGEVEAYRAHWARRVDFVDAVELISWSGVISREDAAGREPCIAPWAMAVVSWDGALVPCCAYVDDRGHRRGTLYDLTRGSLRQGLRAPARGALMRAHLDNDLAAVAPYCVSCRDWRSIPVPRWRRARTLRLLRRAAP